MPWTTDREAGVAATEKPGKLDPQDGKLKEAILVAQLNLPLVGRYSLVYQKVQSSTGSMAMLV